MTKQIETRTIENGVSATISVTDGGVYLVAIHGTPDIVMAASALFEKRGLGWDVFDRMNRFITRCFNVSRMFPAPEDEDNRAANLRVIERDYKSLT